MSGPAVALRPSVPADDAFLRDVYASTRTAELALTGWTEAQQAAFLDQQHRAQDADYRRRHPEGRFLVVELDGVGVGRLYLAWTGPAELRVVDVALLPAHRGAGIGTALMQAVLAEADRAGACVTLHVERASPALGWYTRLGFAVAGGTQVHLRLERPAQLNTAS